MTSETNGTTWPVSKWTVDAILVEAFLLEACLPPTQRVVAFAVLCELQRRTGDVLDHAVEFNQWEYAEYQEFDRATLRKALKFMQEYKVIDLRVPPKHRNTKAYADVPYIQPPTQIQLLHSLPRSLRLLMPPLAEGYPTEPEESVVVPNTTNTMPDAVPLSLVRKQSPHLSLVQTGSPLADETTASLVANESPHYVHGVGGVYVPDGVESVFAPNGVKGMSVPDGVCSPVSAHGMDELGSLPQWVGWQCRSGPNGKTKKIPINPKTGDPASVTDPVSWDVREIAEEARNRFNLDGVGFVFTANDPYVGIDFDDCRNPETEFVNEWAMKRLRALNSYTEVSPSGTGVHVIAMGQIPKGRRSGRIEMYSEGRYFTVTDKHLVGFSDLIVYAGPALSELFTAVTSGGGEFTSKLDDKEVLAKARTSRSAEKFERLWTGDWNGYPSQSEADFALCGMLAYWTDCDPTQMDRLFRQSGLMRDKWDQPGQDGTYGEMTTRNAIEGHRKWRSSKDGGNKRV